MERPFTVYFDTSFYIQLCNADDVTAADIIKTLNALQVRHVLSETILIELLSRTTVPHRDATLVDRVAAFSILPYRTNEIWEWFYLLVSGKEREEAATKLKQLDDEMTRAASWGLVARRQGNNKWDAELLEAARPTLREYGFPVDFSGDEGQAVAAWKAAAKNVIEKIKQVLPAESGEKALDWIDDIALDDPQALLDQLKDLLGPEIYNEVEAQYKLQDSATSSEDRPFRVAAGTADAKVRGRLANTLRDTKRMLEFIKHDAEIDLIQVDRAQWEIINQTTPVHYLAEIGLANRCFIAASLVDTVKKVSELKR
jgi:hypothetical protein